MESEEKKQLLEKLDILRSKPNDGTAGRNAVDVLNELAYKLWTSEPDEMEAYARQALGLAQKLKYTKGKARSYANIGISYWVRGNFDKALSYHLESLKMYEEIGFQQGIASLCSNIGIVYGDRGNYVQALEYFFKALKIYEEIGDERRQSKTYHSLAMVYRHQEDYTRALKYLFKALKIHEATGNKMGIGLEVKAIGTVYCKQGKHKQGQEYLHKALEINEEIGAKEVLAGCLGNIGCSNIDQGNYNQALKYLFKALKLNEEIGLTHACSYDYENIGVCYTRLKKHKSAFVYLKKALRIAQKKGYKNNEVSCYQNLSELYEEQGDYKAALGSYKKYRTAEKEMFNSEKSKQIAEMTARYETEKKEKEAEIYRLKNLDLRKEVRKRKKAEKELKAHRDQLENVVAKRTAKLKATNITLKKEIATRRRAEKESLNYQKQLRSLAHELSLVEERQRRKIATNLHDSISQSLMIVKSSLEMLASAASSKNMKKKLKEIQSQVTQMIQHTRSMTFEISPPVLYELGLEPAMEWLAESFQEQHGISCEFNDDGVAKPVSADWKCILFQSTRELLANIRKHAKANKVLISTRRDGKLIRITVEDDGIGFDPNMLNQKIRKNEGFGLFNLRERLTYLKGSVEIDSEKGEGTTVTLLAPLKRGKRAATRMQA